jgi:thymidylate synthase (FAD)
MKVFLLAQTRLAPEAVDFFTEVDWLPGMECTEGDALAEMAGRLCYKSWKAYDGTQGTNANVTKVREGNVPYIGNIIDSGHGSVLEHINFTFACMGISRVFTHELVRHRAGCAYSQESLRYCRLQDLQVVLPEDPAITPANRRDALEGIMDLKRVIAKLDEVMIAPLKSFSLKKKLTSWLRRIAPIGISTNIIFTANVRALRHMICTRTSIHAEVEIREAFAIVAEKCIEQCPALFQDLYPDDQGQYVSSFTDSACTNTECDYESTVAGPPDISICPECGWETVVLDQRDRSKI